MLFKRFPAIGAPGNISPPSPRNKPVRLGKGAGHQLKSLKPCDFKLFLFSETYIQKNKKAAGAPQRVNWRAHPKTGQTNKPYSLWNYRVFRWRSGWDSNPRYRCRYTWFRVRAVITTSIPLRMAVKILTDNMGLVNGLRKKVSRKPAQHHW